MPPLPPENFLSTATAAPVLPADAAVPGWFGKIPALGDFASRRLPAEFIRRWDMWLAHALEASRAALGPAWLDTYLRGPLWRLALSPGVIDSQFWFGVLMPSVDRVGRYFPLTIATASALPPSAPLAPLAQWYERAAAAALGCLAAGATIETLETALAGVGVPAFAPAAAPPAKIEAASQGAGGSVMARLPVAQGLDQAFAQAAAPVLLHELRGASYWWPRVEGVTTAAIVVHRGLPDAASFVRLLDGTL